MVDVPLYLRREGELVMSRIRCVVSFAAIAAGALWGPWDIRARAEEVVWSDSFSVSMNTFNMNLETAARQSGPLAPIDYVAITPDVTNDFHHQMFDAATAPAQPLQLAGDPTIPAPPNLFAYPTLVSPDHNFVGTESGRIVGKRITFDLDVATFFGSGVDPANSFTQAGITIGANSTLVRNDQATGTGDYFAVHFVEDTCCGAGNLIQFFDGTPADPFNPGEFEFALPLQNHANPAEAGAFNVRLDVDDPSDGNPWDGVGTTDITVFVNDTLIGTQSIGDGGLTNNYITLSGTRDLLSQNLVIHLFDNLTVYALPIPEPNSTALLVMAVCGLAVSARTRRI